MTSEEYVVAKGMFINTLKPSISAIAKELNISRKLLSYKLKADNLYNGKGYDRDTINKAKAMILEGKSMTFICKDLNVDRYAFSRAIGTKQDKGNYNTVQCLNILTDYKNGIRRTELMNKYKISDQKIYAILRFHGVCRDDNGRVHQLDEDVFNVIDTEHKAYWLGFLYADGYVSELNSDIELTLKSDDLIHVKAFKEFLNTTAPISARKINLNGKVYKASRLIVCSKRIVKALVSHGCMQCKSLILKFPNIREDLVHHFMRGYFDGDGYVGVCGNQLRFEVISTREFLHVFKKEIYKNTGISRKRKYGTAGNAYRIKYGGTPMCLKIYKYLYKDATICLERKKIVFTAVLSQRLLKTQDD